MEIYELSSKMHNCAKEYISNGRSDFLVIYVKECLNSIDSVNGNLSEIALKTHNELMRSNKEDNSDKFMDKVLRYCCNYKL